MKYEFYLKAANDPRARELMQDVLSRHAVAMTTKTRYIGHTAQWVQETWCFVCCFENINVDHEVLKVAVIYGMNY